MRGLRLTEIKSEGLKRDFTRYQLWEHPLRVSPDRLDLVWCEGKIIHHLRSWTEAVVYFNGLGPQYDQCEITIEGERWQREII